MNRPLDDDGAYYERRADPDRSDREISLSTATILGIFFALAVVCACFFGFGYTMGHNSARVAQAAGIAVIPASGVGISAAKPTAGSVASHPVATAGQDAAAAQPSQQNNSQTTTVAMSSATTKSAVVPSDRVLVGDKLPVVPQPATGNLQPATFFVVQVAAVSSQDVADILLASLEKKGYAVTVHHGAQDKLLHVQIGPFADRKEAEAMQKRVLADGFNAIVK